MSRRPYRPAPRQTTAFRGDKRPPMSAGPPPLTEAELHARILHRDERLLVLDKPSGLAVHPGPGGGPNLEACFEMLRFGKNRTPNLAHRLDRDTSGCLALGRTKPALAALGGLFAAGRIGKTYWAIVAGRPDGESGIVDLPLRKLTRRDGGWRMVGDALGQEAITEWRLMGRGTKPESTMDISWIEFTPRTGRTHQIRAHAYALGSPVLGDPTYGRERQPADAGSLRLHARALSIPEFLEGRAVSVVAPPPPHMADLLVACGWKA
jgi:tRNA pseudouridine32 synthase/23S rRNA pseudouridine746 synthase